MPITWSPTDKDSGVTLSNGNLTATGADTSNAALRTFATEAKSSGSGDFWWEIAIPFLKAGSVILVGVHGPTRGPRFSTPGKTDSFGISWASHGYNSANANEDYVPASTFTTGDKLGLALKTATGKLDCFKNGTLVWSATTSLSSFLPFVAPYNNDVATANFSGPFQFTPPAGAVGYDAATAQRALPVAPASLALVAQPAFVRLGHVLPAQPSSIALAAKPVRLAMKRRLPVVASPLTLTPRPAAVLLGHMLPVQPAALTIAAPAVRMGVGFRLAAMPAALALTTGGAMLRAVRLLAAQAASIVVTGQALSVRAGRRLRAETAAIVATGGSVALNRVGRLALAVTPTAIVVDAAAVTLRMARLLRAAPAAIGVEAQAVRLAVQRRLRVAPATISLLSAAVALRLGSAAILIPSAGRTIVIVDQGSRSLLIGDAGSRRLII